MPVISSSARLPRRSLGTRLRIGLRFSLLFLLLGFGACLVALQPLLNRKGISRTQCAALWFRLMLSVLGVRLRVHGELPREPVLIAANHISWVDIVAITAATRAVFLSKSEVRDWPLIGWFAQSVGTIYLPRGGHQTREANDALVSCLNERQNSVAIFPEGTTTGQRLPKPFHARLFAAAIESGRAVQPVALRYPPPAGRHDDQHPAAPYIDDIGFSEHLFALLAAREVTLDLTFCPQLHPIGHDRRALAHATRESICYALGGPVPLVPESETADAEERGTMPLRTAASRNTHG
jgi:1-acyl-sn-glycerol-3-phosphate acyltransferase